MNIKFDEFGQWVKIDGNTAYVGISDMTQKMLGSIVFIKFPELHSACKSRDELGTIEALKTVQEIYSPISGTVVRINDTLIDNPARINKDPYGTWLYALSDINMEEYEKLYSLAEYEVIFKGMKNNSNAKLACGGC